MNMTKNMGVAVIAVLMGLATGAGAADFGELAGMTAAGLKAAPAAAVMEVPEVTKGYVEPVEPFIPVKYVTIPGGKFIMGTTQAGSTDTKPIREVTIKTFQMAETVVTVEQYAECVDKGACTKPHPGYSNYCNWGKPGRRKYPVNCVDWNQAQAYAKFKGARLPSEAEFEYAATSGGRNQKYPWGNQEPTHELAVFNTNSTMRVCSKPNGNTAQGLCDMSGNVRQWVQDTYQTYEGAPVDGSAVETPGRYRVLRGGGFYYAVAGTLRADARYFAVPGGIGNEFGFRLAR